MGTRVGLPQAGGSGIFHSPALRIGEVVGGAMSGDPMLVAGGLANPGSPAANAIGMASKADKLSGAFGNSLAPGAAPIMMSDNPEGTNYLNDTDQMDAIKRRLSGYQTGVA